MSLLTDAERLHLVDTHVGMPNPRYPLENSDWISYAKATESALLAKLAVMELPEWSKRDDLGGLVPSEIRQALRQAYAQGAASQLSAECVATTTCDCYPDHGGTLYAEAVLPEGTELFTRKEPS